MSTAPATLASPESESAASTVQPAHVQDLLARIFTFPAMLGSLLAVLAALTVRNRLNDPDLWWHLKVGQFIWKNHSIPVTDLYSYTTNHHAWIPHEWLAQLTIFSAYQAGSLLFGSGLAGLMLWLVMVSSAVLIFGYLLCTLYSGNAKVGFLGGMLVFFFATVGFSIRPQMLGYLLFIVELVLIHLGRTRNPRWFLLLAPLFAIWINVHGSFFLGLLIIGALLFSSYFQFETGSLAAARWSARTRNTLYLALGLVLAALFLNPVGVSQIFYPLDAMLHQPVNLANIAEWQPLELTSARGFGLLLVLAAILLPLLLRVAILTLDEVVLLALGTWLALSHERMLFVFGILAAPILTRLIAPWWDDKMTQSRWWPNAVLMAASVAVIVAAFPSQQNLTEQVAAQSPVKAVEYIQSHHLSGPMLNEYNYGGYLIWALPEHPVFVDGRADIFEWTGILAEMRDWATLQDDPNQLLDKHHISYILLSSQSPMARVIALLPTWKQAYSDNNAVIFIRNQPQIAAASATKTATAGE